ncbi:hypothetical protein THH46_24940 [Pseudomonas sp. NA13]
MRHDRSVGQSHLQGAPTLGEGCLSRYDPDALSPEDGTEFPDAAQLWEQLHPQDEPEQKP